ncbi:MAG: HupE/UreJ family protein [Betaproteobacteria bacterium]|nr:HupE/UreJ family protein [Betaproteobacteria bacterium]
MNGTQRSLILSILLMLAAGTAQAHSSVFSHTHGFMDGIAHPLTGIDHMLAMIAVGIWACLGDSKRIWQGPLAFVCALIAGAAAGLAGIHFPFVESLIAASLIVCGIMLVVTARGTPSLGLALIALMGIVHGLAHGQETPPEASFALYALGFVACTVALHCSGILIGRKLRNYGHAGFRTAGATVGAAGIFFLAAPLLA